MTKQEFKKAYSYTRGWLKNSKNRPSFPHGLDEEAKKAAFASAETAEETPTIEERLANYKASKELKWL